MKRPSDVSRDCGLPGPLRTWMLRRHGLDQDQAREARLGSPPPASREPELIGHPLGAQFLPVGVAPEAELARIREICGELGADAEMTFLVVTSLRRDRAPLDVILSAGSDVKDYVRHRLAIWEAILGADERPRPDRSRKLGSPRVE